MPTTEPSAAPAAGAATTGPGQESRPAAPPAAEPAPLLHEVPETGTRLADPVVLRMIRLVSDRLGFFGMHDQKEASWEVLGHEQFRRYFVGSLVSNVGTWLQNTAQMLLAYQLRHSVFMVGLVTCAQFSSPLLLGPWAGWLTDRNGRRRTLVATQVVSVVITTALAVLQFSHVLGERTLLAGAFATGLMFTFALPAQSAIIPSLVPSDGETKAAMAMNSVSYNAGRALAPAFGVLIVTTIGFGWAFTLNAVSFAVFTVVLLTVRPCSPLPAAVRSRIRDGFGIAWEERKIMLLLIMVAMVTFADDPVLVLGPALSRHIGMPPDFSGYFLAALGTGSVLGSLLPRNKSQSARRTATALALLGVSIVVFALVPSIWISAGAAFAAGLAGLVAGSAAQAMLVGMAGPERAVRVMGLWTVAWAGSKPIASIIDGSLPSLVGIRITGVLLASPTFLPIIMLIFCPSIVQWVLKPRRLAVPDSADPIQAREIEAAARA